MEFVILFGGVWNELRFRQFLCYINSSWTMKRSTTLKTYFKWLNCDSVSLPTFIWKPISSNSISYPTLKMYLQHNSLWTTWSTKSLNLVNHKKDKLIIRKNILCFYKSLFYVNVFIFSFILSSFSVSTDSDLSRSV